MKPERRVAPCVYYTMRKHDKITRMMAVFLGISTIAGILLGVLFSVCYAHCKESQARVEAKMAAVPYDHIAARARRADEKRRAAGQRTFAPRSGSGFSYRLQMVALWLLCRERRVNNHVFCDLMIYFSQVTTMTATKNKTWKWRPCLWTVRQHWPHHARRRHPPPTDRTTDRFNRCGCGWRMQQRGCFNHKDTNGW